MTWQYYTGVGSRNTPIEIIRVMADFSEYIANKGWILRSGGADGADKAFHRGHMRVRQDKKQIFVADDCTPEAMAIAAKFHPAWDRCSNYAKKLHGRNAMQLLGPWVEKPIRSRFMICWTPDGCTSHVTRTIKTGGTGTAISIAEEYNIRIYNIRIPSQLAHIKSKIYKNKRFCTTCATKITKSDILHFGSTELCAVCNNNLEDY